MAGEDVVKSVGRVFEVLQLFDEAREPLNATQVERRLNYPQSSTLALLKSLVKLGYLSFDRIERSYFPTMRVAYLGQWLDSSLLGSVHLPAMIEEIAERTGETVALSCQNDLQMQFLQIRPGTKPLTVNIRAGEFAPLFDSIIGQTILSAQAEDSVDKLVKRYNRRERQAGKKIVLSELMTKVREIGERGYGFIFETYVHGIGAVAWVLPNENSVRPVVLSVSGPSESIREELDDIVRHVRSAFRAYL